MFEDVSRMGGSQTGQLCQVGLELKERVTGIWVVVKHMFMIVKYQRVKCEVIVKGDNHQLRVDK